MPIVALYGGVALYLLAHIAFRLRTLRSLNIQRLAVALVLVAAIPLAWRLPAVASLGIVAALMVGLTVYESTRLAETREAIRHAGH